MTIAINGSMGEGGGQILRTSLGLSLVTGKPFQIDRIRAGRKRPGLQRQHLTAVEAAAAIGRAQTEGAELYSQFLSFQPAEPMHGEYHFSVGSAGSATLVLQTILPALLTAGGPSFLILEGGTHNPFAPTYDFLEKAFLPLVNRMGPEVTVELARPGFYPAGGGKMGVRIEPASKLSGFDLSERGRIRNLRARAIVANLPLHIAERELKIVKERTGWRKVDLSAEELKGTPGRGNVFFIEIESESLTEVFTGFGRQGVRAETVASRAVRAAKRYVNSGVPVAEHLADQLLVPMALAGEGSFKTFPLTSHGLTNIEVIKTFLDVDVAIIEEEEDQCTVRIG